MLRSLALVRWLGMPNIRLLKQQSSITIHPLPTKENKLLFSISVCSKQTEVCRFPFQVAANEWKLPFIASSVFLGVCECVCVYCCFRQKMENGNPVDFP